MIAEISLVTGLGVGAVVMAGFEVVTV